jgi:hypothetical protein
MGRGFPLWTRDTNAWQSLVREAETHRGDRPHLEYVLLNGVEYDVLPNEQYPKAIQRVLRAHGTPKDQAMLLPLVQDAG